MSRAFASRISSVRASSASAIAWRAAFLVSVSSRASVRAAPRAAAQTSATDWAVVAIGARVPGLPSVAVRRDDQAGGGAVSEQLLARLHVETPLGRGHPTTAV